MSNEISEITQEIEAKKKKKSGYFYRRKKTPAAPQTQQEQQVVKTLQGPQNPPQGQQAQSQPQHPPQGQPVQRQPQNQPQGQQVQRKPQNQPQSQPVQNQPQGQQTQSLPQSQPAQSQPQGQPAQSQPQGQQPQNQPQGQPHSRSRKRSPRGVKKPTDTGIKLRIIPLGGIEEIGKNMTVVEYGDDMIVIDAGMAFPNGDMPGIDLVIPDVTYLTKNFEKFRGILLTHGHEDHIGALPYILKHLKVPVYGTKLTLGIVRSRLVEHKLADKAKMIEVAAGDKIRLGVFEAEFIHVNHSIPDAVSIAITTPVGVILFTGDFKIDSSPIQGEMINLARFGEIGNNGVLAMFADSTNAERPGWTPSERIVGAAFESLFKNNEKRIVIATFSSNTHRVQQIIDAAVKFGRKVAISGRSMETTVRVAAELGMMDVPEGTVIDLSMIHRYTKDKLVLITTGSQGEPMSALARMASSDHRKVEIGPSDMVILSATPIPGNEKTVSKVINELLKLGAEVIYDKIYDIHVSGHACQEELKLMLQLVKPKYFIPVHGEYRMLYKHSQLAKAIGFPPENIILPGIGKVLELSADSAEFNGSVPSGVVLIDGLGVGDVGNIVLKERKKLSDDGLLVIVFAIEAETGQVVSGPDIVSRGFVFMRESEALIDGAKQLAKQVIDRQEGKYNHNWGALKNEIRDDVSDYIFTQTRRSPMILPIILEI